MSASVKVRRVLIAMVVVLVAGSVWAGQVFVTTSPPTSGARVYLDGQSRGTTSAEGTFVLEPVAPGSHTLRLVLSDGSVVETPCTAGQTASRIEVEVPRSAAPPAESRSAAVLISSNVGGAKIEVDGRAAGRVGSHDGSRTIAVTPGRHSIRLSADGYAAQEKVVDVAPGPAGLVSFTLRQASAPGPTATGGSGALMWALIAILGVAVAAVSGMAYHVVLQGSGRRVTTRRIGRYEVREVLGRGGMATVYKATDTTRRGARPVALKVLDEGHMRDEDLVRKFVREGEVLRWLNREDPEAPLVQVFHHGRAGGEAGRPFIAMELLVGEDLLAHLKRRRRLPVNEAAWIVAGVARALKPAHAAGIYHRDLTPDNVYLVERPRGGFKLRLFDFGVARHEYTSHGTLDGSIAGKPPYMSPEQCQGLPVDGRSDIYALGVMLYALVFGAPPFVHTNPLEVMRMHKEEPVSYPAGTAAPLRSLLSSALEKDRERRCPSVDYLYEALLRLRRTG